MQVTPNEIASIEEAGSLDASPVRLIRTKGGFWIAVGKPKGRLREEALAAGSHPAIVKFNLEKQFPQFQASMMKSEAFSESNVVEKHSHFLSDDLRKSGHDIYSVQTGADIEFHITKHDLKISTALGHLENGAVIITKLEVPKEFARAMAGAAAEKTISNGASKLRLK